MQPVGQQKLVDKISKLSLDSLPHFLLLCGEKGCGKHFMCNLIAEQLNLELQELLSKVDESTALSISENTQPAIYVVDLNQCLPKVQGSLLKLVEEPNPATFFILLTTSLNLVIPTLLNRCQHWFFEKYSRDELSLFINPGAPDRDLILELATNPGQVLGFQQQSITEVMQLATNVVEKMAVASPSSALHISDRISFKGEQDKIDAELFILLLRYNLAQRIRRDPSPVYINMYKSLLDYSNKRELYIIPQRALDLLLINLWEAARAE